MARVETARGRTSDRVLCETSNKRDHDKQFLLQWRRGANTPYFQDNSCRGGGGSLREACCLFRIHRRFPCFNANMPFPWHPSFHVSNWLERIRLGCVKQDFNDIPSLRTGGNTSLERIELRDGSLVSQVNWRTEGEDFFDDITKKFNLLAFKDG